MFYPGIHAVRHAVLSLTMILAACSAPASDEEFLPTMPSGLGPVYFVEDPGLEPRQPYIGTISPGEMSFLRPLAAIQAEQDGVWHFVADEVVVKPSSPEQLEEFLYRCGGVLLQGPELPDPPAGSGIDPAPVEGDGGYLVKVLAPPAADPGALDARADALGIRGEIRVSSAEGLALLGMVLEEREGGVDVSLNTVLWPAQHFPRLKLEDEPKGSSYENPMTYLENRDTGVQKTRANRAWQWMDFSTRQSAIYVAIIDGGFCLDGSGKPGKDKSGRTCKDIPNYYYQYDFIDDDYVAEGSAQIGGISDHGSGVMSVALGVADNHYGTAGIGSPVARAILFKVSGSRFEFAKAVRNAAKWGADVINMSLGTTFGWLEVAFADASGYNACIDALKVANAYDAVTVASAGNEGEHMSDDYFFPCKTKYVDLCVGALALNSLDRADYSNYGWIGTAPGVGGVDVFAPGRVAAGPTADHAGNHAVKGTSIASPFVAGAAALVRAVNPSANRHQVRQIIMSTLRPAASSETAPGSIDVLAAVQAAGGPVADIFNDGNSDPIAAAYMPDSGLKDLTVVPGITDHFEYDASQYLASVTIAARSVAALGELEAEPTAAGGGTTGRTTGSQTTDDWVKGPAMCVGDTFAFKVRGATSKVGNAFDLLVLSKTQSTSLAADVNEPANSNPSTPTALAAPRITNMEVMTAFPTPDCRSGLTLHTTSDVDHFKISVNASDLNSTYTALGVEVLADFPITVSLLGGGAVAASTKTAKYVYIEAANASAGDYALTISGTTLNAYTLRARVVAPGWNVRNWELEQWLKHQLLVLPDPVPGGGSPLPSWMVGFPWDPATELAMAAAGVLPVLGSSQWELEFGGEPLVLAVGTAEPGALSIGIGELQGEWTSDGLQGVHAVLLSPAGEALWGTASVTEGEAAEIDIEPGRTHLLVVNGPAGAVATLNLGLPQG